MPELNEETVEGVPASEEMIKLHRALATVASNAIVRTTNGDSPQTVADELIAFANQNTKCPPGTIWDASIGDCVKI